MVIYKIKDSYGPYLVNLYLISILNYLSFPRYVKFSKGVTTVLVKKCQLFKYRV